MINNVIMYAYMCHIFTYAYKNGMTGMISSSREELESLLKSVHSTGEAVVLLSSGLKFVVYCKQG